LPLARGEVRAPVRREPNHGDRCETNSAPWRPRGQDARPKLK
jgi:hypothetical protein